MSPDAGPLGGVIEHSKAGGQAESIEFFVTGGDVEWLMAIVRFLCGAGQLLWGVVIAGVVEAGQVILKGLGSEAEAHDAGAVRLRLLQDGGCFAER